IWRIVPQKHKTKALRPAMGKREIGSDDLDEANAWRRMTAHRLLLERKDRWEVRGLRVLTTSASEYHRLHALWILEGLGGLDEDTLRWEFVQENDPRVQEHLVRLAEPWLGKSARLREYVIRLARSESARVRFQVALSLGEWDDDRTLKPLAAIALYGAEDRWTRLAVASAVPKRAGALIRRLLPPTGKLTEEAAPGRLALLQELSALVGARRDADEVVGVLEALEGLSEKDRAR